ncbi:hypothetical protein psal_cds_1127 [Pandoravirus salinus]|uniref:Uncharacterized protein n=1 Tax=Pandoravirus salinus TaxID=1349410 RepID=S4VYC6_9VIRU|nr:hypothetical protein psal_cds_1127 [Pandoravirus salinus]AGO85368.1 hypothetical protein psal_cds_1127 [Pandoravirus salinus]
MQQETKESPETARSDDLGSGDAFDEPARQAPKCDHPVTRPNTAAPSNSASALATQLVVLRSAEEIRDTADAFMASGETRRTVAVRSHLRRSMGARASATLGCRVDKRKTRRGDNHPSRANSAGGGYARKDAAIVPPPGVDYVCLGTGEVLWLRMTRGAPEPLTWTDLCDRTRKAFVDTTGLVLPTTYRDGRVTPSIDVDDLDAVEPFVGLRSRWMPLLDKAVRAIGSERSLDSLHEAVKTDVRNWIARNDAIARWAAREPIVAPQPETTPTWDASPPVYKHPRFTRGHYAVQNTGRHFVSIDMRAASHAILLVEGLIQEPTWRDVVVQAASAPKATASVIVANDDLIEYIVSLKKLRASALAVGSGHGRQMALMACVMAQLFERLVDAGVIIRADLAHFGRDELVFHVADFTDAAAKIDAIQEVIRGDRWAPHLAYSTYRMEEIGAEAIGYVLVHDDAHWQLKCTDGAHAAEYARLWRRRVAETPALGNGHMAPPTPSDASCIA